MVYESDKFVNFQPKSVTLQNELADKHYVNICILCNVFHNFLRVLNILLTKSHIFLISHACSTFLVIKIGFNIFQLDTICGKGKVWISPY